MKSLLSTVEEKPKTSRKIQPTISAQPPRLTIILGASNPARNSAATTKIAALHASRFKNLRMALSIAASEWSSLPFYYGPPNRTSHLVTSGPIMKQKQSTNQKVRLHRFTPQRLALVHQRITKTMPTTEPNTSAHVGVRTGSGVFSWPGGGSREAVTSDVFFGWTVSWCRAASWWPRRRAWGRGQ